MMWQRNSINEPSYKSITPYLLNTLSTTQYKGASIQVQICVYRYIIHKARRIYLITKNMFFGQFLVMLLPHSICFPATLSSPSSISSMYKNSPSHTLPVYTQIDAIWTRLDTTYSEGRGYNVR